jgi:hypothetical protein
MEGGKSWGEIIVKVGRGLWFLDKKTDPLKARLEDVK